MPRFNPYTCSSQLLEWQVHLDSNRDWHGRSYGGLYIVSGGMKLCLIPPTNNRQSSVATPVEIDTNFKTIARQNYSYVLQKAELIFIHIDLL